MMVSFDKDVVTDFIRSTMMGPEPGGVAVVIGGPGTVADFLLLAESEQDAAIKTWAAAREAQVTAERDALASQVADKDALLTKLGQAKL